MSYQNCPYNGKRCIDGWRSDFEVDPATGAQSKCQLWRQVRGKRAQSDEVVDKFDCVHIWVLEALIENTQRIMHTGVAVQEVRNVILDVSPPHAAERAIENSMRRMLVQSTEPSLTQGEVKPNPIGQAIVNELENRVGVNNNGNGEQPNT